MPININHQNETLTTASGILTHSDTGGFIVPSGNNISQKPSVTSHNGLIRYNTTNNVLEAIINGAYYTLATISDISGVYVAKAGDTMSGTLVLKNSASAATPALTFSGSTTSGLFTPTANVVGISTNSIERARIDTNGNLLVGVQTIPAQANSSGVILAPSNASGVNSLFVKGYNSGITINGYLPQLNLTDGNLVGGVISGGTAGALQVGTTSNSPLAFISNNIERMRVGTSGGLAIAGTVVNSGTVLDMSGASTSFLTPVGNTAARPSTAINGMMRYNSDLNQFEGYANNAWGSIGGGSNFITQTFAAGTDFTAGTSTSVTLTNTPFPSTQNAMSIYFDGVFQNYSEWSYNNSVITFTSAIPLLVSKIQVLWIVGLATPLTNFPQGTQALPGLYVTGNTATGFYQSATNNLAICTNGVSRLSIDSAGNVNIPVSITSPSIRIRLMENTTYYVATTGNDLTGNGTSSNPWATIQKAVNYVHENVDLNGYGVTIQVADGTYTSGVVISGDFVGARPASAGISLSAAVTISGNINTPTNCILTVTGTSCISAFNTAQINIQGFTVNTYGSSVSDLDIGGLVAWFGAKIYITGNMNFSTCVGPHMSAFGAGSLIYLNSSYTISGSARNHWCGTIGPANIMCRLTNAIAITLTGNPAFAAFASVSDSSVLFIPGNITFSGSATGLRYTVYDNGLIWTESSGASYFPGSTAGVSDSISAYR